MENLTWKIRREVLVMMSLGIAGCVTASPMTTGYAQAPAPSPRTQLVNSNRLIGGEGSDQDVQTFDSFILASATRISHICWRGSASDADLSGFTLTLYPATPNAFAGPDLAHPLAVIEVSGNANEMPAGPLLSDYSASLETPLSLTANTKYWLSIVANKTALSPWGWANSLEGDGTSIQSQAEFKVLPADGDRAFCLNPSAAPSP